MTDLATFNSPALAVTTKVLARSLAMIGWVRIEEITIGEWGPGTYRIEVHRADGRWVRLTAFSSGSVSLDRYHRDPCVRRGYGDGPQYSATQDTYLGSIRAGLGPRSGLRALADYMADNPSPQVEALGRVHARDALRALARLLPE